jgi:hypothetical protein
MTTNDPAGTFTANTEPTATQVTELIGQACTMVVSRTGLPVMDTVTEVADACRVAAALWAAYWVELGYPERDADVSVYDRLRTDAEAATKAAIALNTAAGGGTSLDPPDDGSAASAAVPTFSFPDPPVWADTSTYW